MQISTVVRLDLSDVQKAVLSYIKDELDVSDNASIEATFDVDNNQFIVEIESDEASSEPGSEPEKKTRRKRRTKAEMAAAAAEPEDKDEPEEKSSKANEAQESEPSDEKASAAADQQKQEDDDTPWDDPKPAAEKTISQTIAAAEAAEKKADAPKIFPDKVSSAAPSTPKPEPLVSPKSLFANLAAPVSSQTAN